MMDIVETAIGSQTGFLAVDSIEYAECIADILFNAPEENNKIREAARYVFFLQRCPAIARSKTQTCSFFLFAGHRARGFPRNNLKLIL